jgi:hypothetical protein
METADPGRMAEKVRKRGGTALAKVSFTACLLAAGCRLLVLDMLLLRFPRHARQDTLDSHIGEALRYAYARQAGVMVRGVPLGF